MDISGNICKIALKNSVQVAKKKKEPGDDTNSLFKCYSIIWALSHHLKSFLIPRTLSHFHYLWKAFCKSNESIKINFKYHKIAISF